jgi:enoyl-CoA hydratase/carnithine racemase
MRAHGYGEQELAIEAATERELVEQDWLRRTEDFKEGVKAMADRRLPDFQGT